MKSKAFTLPELIIVIAILVMLFSLLAGPAMRWRDRRLTSINNPQPTSIQEVEKRLLDGYTLRVFVDTNTNRRILYYRDAMAVLPDL